MLYERYVVDALDYRTLNLLLTRPEAATYHPGGIKEIKVTPPQLIAQALLVIERSYTGVQSACECKFGRQVC
jgi:hypothetical protein